MDAPIARILKLIWRRADDFQYKGPIKVYYDQGWYLEKDSDAFEESYYVYKFNEDKGGWEPLGYKDKADGTVYFQYNSRFSSFDQ